MENQERKKIRVRIVKASSKRLWYRDRIGQEIEVFEDIHFDSFPEPEGQWYTVAHPPRHFLRVEDCEVIPESWAVRVRIRKCENKSLWYADMIGREFEAIPHEASEGFHLFQVEGNQSPAYIRRDDCEVIPEESKPAGPIGREEGAVCNRNGCPGKIVIVYDPERRCACHINPPCSRCMDSVLKCDQCGAEPMEEEVRETLAIPEAAPADEIQPDETWPGFNGLQAYRNGDFPDGMIPFFMQGDLGKFEQMYSDQITLLSVDDLSVVRNLLSAIWHFGNDQWQQGCDYGRKNPAKEASPNDGQEMPPSPYNRLKQWADTGEKERIFSVMVAAAEYLKEEWEKLVDDAGCGPANLCHRLENCIAELYPGYTAGAFEEMGNRQTELEGQIQRMERTLEESAARADGLQNELDGAREYAVALKEEVAVAEREAKADREALAALTAKIRAVIADSVQCRIKPHELRGRLISIMCGRDVPEQELRERAILEELVRKLCDESAKWEHRGRQAEAMQEALSKDCKAWEARAETAETRLKHADSMLEFFRRKNMKIRRQILQARDSFNDSIPEGEMNAMNVFQLLNAVREHTNRLDWIANLPTTEENLQPMNEEALALGCSNDRPAVAVECSADAGMMRNIDHIEFRFIHKSGKGGIEARAITFGGATAFAMQRPTLEILLDDLRRECRVRITKETAEAELKAWAAPEGAKSSPEKVWREFQMKGPGGNPAEMDTAPETWWQRLRKKWRLIREGWAAARDINTNGPSDQ